MIPVIILNYNGMNFLEGCIDSIEKQSYSDLEIIVVDNASKDGSVEFLKEKYPDIRVWENDKNYGFASGYNRIIGKTNAKYVALLNNDVTVDEDWLKNLINCIEANPNALACGSKILLKRPAGIVNHAGARISIIGGGWDHNFLEPDSPRFEEQPTSSACGAAMILNREIFLKLGGFDDDFFAYFEDADLCYRAWLSGYDVKHCPQSIAYHVLSASWGRKISLVRLFLSERNRVQMVLKDFEAATLAASVLAIFLLDVERVLNCVRGRRVSDVLSLAYAYMWIVRNLSGILRKRRLVQSKRRISDRKLKAAKILVGLKEIVAERSRLRLRRRELGIPEGYI